MLEHERQALTKRFIEKVEHYTPEQLQVLISSFHREMAHSRLPFPEDLEVNYRILAALKARQRELSEAKDDLSPEERIKQEAERLAKAHGVTLKVAQEYVERQRTRDPLDAPRHHRKPAPDPEPAEAEPTAREKWEEKWGRI